MDDFLFAVWLIAFYWMVYGLHKREIQKLEDRLEWSMNRNLTEAKLLGLSQIFVHAMAKMTALVEYNGSVKQLMIPLQGVDQETIDALYQLSDDLQPYANRTGELRNRLNELINAKAGKLK